ncbi:hypothetical protein D4L85_18165 [Chryseolinea soli]|uniref:Uncharacterized protein n=1 Tax=Chryseolinea soli TaxID=2321403 RepID=A0A385SPA9_9BACT|nr:hypothetical protein D4L85_18165 [Chryseolinea soli]
MAATQAGEMLRGKRYLYLVGRETRVVKIRMSVDERVTMVVKTFRPVIKVLMPVVCGVMLVEGAFKMVVGMGCCMITVRMLVVKSMMWFVKME